MLGISSELLSDIHTLIWRDNHSTAEKKIASKSNELLQMDTNTSTEVTSKQ